MKHHYIPQFYLKPWEGKDRKLQVYQRRRGDNLIITTRLARKATGYEVDLYKLPGVTPEGEHHVEKTFMAPVDDKAVRARDHLLTSEEPMTPGARTAWAQFVLSLVMRNPEELKKFKADYIEHMLKPDPHFQARYEAARREGDPALFEEWIMKSDPTYVERQAVIALTNLMGLKNVLKLFGTMYWRVIDFSGIQRRLLSSDRPVVMTNGMGRYDGHYALPMSPTSLFFATTTQEYSNEICSWPRGKLIREMNRIVVGQAQRFVYGVNDSALAEVRRGFGKLEPPSIIPSFKAKA